MPDILMGGVCFYFAYTCLMPLWDVPFASWELMHFLSVLVGLLLILVGSLRFIKAFKAQKSKYQQSQDADTLPPANDVSNFSDDDNSDNDASDDGADFDNDDD